MTAEQTILVDPELARQALGDVLERDAAQAPAASPPPLKPRPPDATDEAPWGFKADGTARKGPPGPGRPRKDRDSEPRTEAAASSSSQGSGDPSSPSSAAASTEDYSGKIEDAITTVWMGAALIPWTQAPAALLKRQAPELIAAWNTAAQQNAAVRRRVLQFSGEGSYAWVLPVTVATTPLVLGIWETVRNKQLRLELAAQTREDWADFLTAATAAVAEAEAQAIENYGNGSSSSSSSSSPNSSMTPTPDLLEV